MCELLGMNANVPTDICFSFSGLMQRGGRTGPHADGWGISFYEGRGCRTFHDPHRQANRGRVCLENPHPFVRELWGRNWSFAHNGQLTGIKRRVLRHFQPVGTTDSEHAFCWLLDQVRERYPRPPRAERGLWRLIGALCGELRELGVFNMLLCDSRSLYAHCGTELCWLTRQAPFGEAHLIDRDFAIDFSQETASDDIVTVIATRPLTTNETWHSMRCGELAVFRAGQRCR